MAVNTVQSEDIMPFTETNFQVATADWIKFLIANSNPKK